MCVNSGREGKETGGGGHEVLLQWAQRIQINLQHAVFSVALYCFGFSYPFTNLGRFFCGDESSVFDKEKVYISNWDSSQAYCSVYISDKKPTVVTMASIDCAVIVLPGSCNASYANMGFNNNPIGEGRNPITPEFDPAILQHSDKIPDEYVWPEEDCLSGQECSIMNEVPTIDLSEILGGLDEMGMKYACQTVRKACSEHGFFQVINHGVSSQLVDAAHEHMDLFFSLPLQKKQKALRKVGESCGYASSFTGRFTSKLPWKETLSLDYSPQTDIEDYFEKVMGCEFSQTGIIYKKYCQAMESLSLAIMELLAVSLGVERMHFRRFFEKNNSIMRLNGYPPCQQPALTFGTGPHCDPTSLTILHQDQVGGLEVFIKDRWLSVQPIENVFVVNIGDTFMALSNGMYKSCPHRAVVNPFRFRKSIAFFLNPCFDRIVRPPADLVDSEHPRKYHDFTWSMFLQYTQKHYRSDMNTLASFNQWLALQNKNND
eukprot:Gb_34188 [translate_table: standard]